MSIADGEYDIDLSELLGNSESSNSNSFAIRYGFIPDSMDQASPLKLYQTSKECLLQANSIETSTSSKPIIFEGAHQRHRKSNNPALDSYYLTFAPQDSISSSSSESSGSNTNNIQLRRLNSTIRVSKSRDARKWERKIENWNEQGNTSEQIDFPHVGQANDPKRLAKSNAPSASSENKLKPRFKEAVNAKKKLLTNSRDTIRPKESTHKPDLRPLIASKRPPTATPEIKNDIISESDFDALEMDDDTTQNNADFPMIIFDEDEDEDDGEKKMKRKVLLNAKLETEEVSPYTQTLTAEDKKAGKSSSINRHENNELADKRALSKELVNLEDDEDEREIDMDDDFKDLEDQLQEVLGKDEPSAVNSKSPSSEPEHSQKVPHAKIVSSIDSTTGNNESNDDDDSDADDYHFSGAPIIINFDDNDSEKSNNTYANAYSSKTEKKPMSLRDLYGGGNKNDDLSSSEAE